MLIIIALIPSIILLLYIYRKDRIEKESIRFLTKCFLWGIAIVLPVAFLETVMGIVLDETFIEGSIGYAIVDGFIVAALSEEFCKYTALKLRTWKSVEFNSSFDGIVYAVFVSLGFATFENILYVIDGDLSTALFRMFTAVPGHAYDAVFMGFFYSCAKKAEIEGNRFKMKINRRLSLIIPILFHGAYDCLLSFDEEVVGEAVSFLGFYLWIILVIAEFVWSLILVNIASKDDTAFLPNSKPM